MDFETIQRQHENIRRKILRCKESGDLKRLLGLRDQLERVRQNIDEIKPDFEATEHAIFRKSYRYEAYVEALLAGKKLRPFAH